MNRFEDASRQIVGSSWLDELARKSLAAAEKRFVPNTLVIPAEAVEAAAKARLVSYGPWSLTWDQLNAEDKAEELAEVRRMFEAAAPHMQAHLLAFADERDNALGAIRSHITTYELRKLLGATGD